MAAVKEPLKNKASSTPVTSDTLVASHPFDLFVQSFKRILNLNLVTMLALTLLLMVTTSLAASLGASIAHDIHGSRGILVWHAVFIAVDIVVLMVLLASLLVYSLATARGKVISLRACVTSGYQKAAGFIGLAVLTALIVAAGLVALVIPGLIFIFWFIFASYIFMDKQIGIAESLRASKALSKKQPKAVLGLFLAGIVFSLPSFLPLIGIIYQVLFNAAWYVAWASLYEKLAKAG